MIEWQLSGSRGRDVIDCVLHLRIVDVHLLSVLSSALAMQSGCPPRAHKSVHISCNAARGVHLWELCTHLVPTFIARGPKALRSNLDRTFAVRCQFSSHEAPWRYVTNANLDLARLVGGPTGSPTLDPQETRQLQPAALHVLPSVHTTSHGDKALDTNRLDPRPQNNRGTLQEQPAAL